MEEENSTRTSGDDINEVSSTGLTSEEDVSSRTAIQLILSRKSPIPIVVKAQNGVNMQQDETPSVPRDHIKSSVDNHEVDVKVKQSMSKKGSDVRNSRGASDVKTADC